MNKELISAYRWNRLHSAGNAYPRKRGPNPAHEALRRAREDVANGKRRYLPPIYPAVTWQPGKPGLAYVENIERAGLREVGRVMPECGRDGIWDSRGNCGWYTNAHGETFRDGTGLAWGVVYQLPGRDGKARFVAGYVMGDCDGGPMVDFGTVYEENCRAEYFTVPGPGSVRYGSWSYSDNPLEMDAAREAAYAADSMAQRAAEEEREWQTAWEAGSRFADLGETVDGLKSDIRDLLAERKAAKAHAATYPTICQMLHQAVADKLESIADARRDREKLKSGDFESLIFYPDARLRAAFNEGAGESVFQV